MDGNDGTGNESPFSRRRRTRRTRGFTSSSGTLRARRRKFRKHAVKERKSSEPSPLGAGSSFRGARGREVVSGIIRMSTRVGQVPSSSCHSSEDTSSYDGRSGSHGLEDVRPAAPSISLSTTDLTSHKSSSNLNLSSWSQECLVKRFRPLLGFLETSVESSDLGSEFIDDDSSIELSETEEVESRRVMTALLRSEMDYISTLRLLTRAQRCLLDVHKIPPEALEIIFGRIPVIVALHRSLLADLTLAVSSVRKFASVFHSQIPFFRMYTDIWTERKEASKAVTALSSRYKEAGRYLQRIADEGSFGCFDDILHVPVGRVVVYIQTVRSLERVFKASEAKDTLRILKRSLTRIKLELEEKHHHREKARRTMELRDQLKGYSITPSPSVRVIYEGELVNARLSSGAKVKHGLALLMTNVLLICARRPRAKKRKLQVKALVESSSSTGKIPFQQNASATSFSINGHTLELSSRGETEAWQVLLLKWVTTHNARYGTTPYLNPAHMRRHSISHAFRESWERQRGMLNDVLL